MSLAGLSANKRRHFSEEVFGLEVDAALAGGFKQDGLHVGRDQTIRAATVLAIHPTANAALVAVRHVSNGFYAAAECDYGMCWLHHGAKCA